MSEYNRYPNFKWLMANADNRYSRLPEKLKQVASILNIDQSRLSEMSRGARFLSAAQAAKLVDDSGLLEVHPEFQVTWLDLPADQFLQRMVAISFGNLKSDQPLDSLSARLPALPNASLVDEDVLTSKIGRAAQRGDIGADLALDLEPKGSILFRAKFGIQLREPGPDMARAVVSGTTTCLLLYRPVRTPVFVASPCAQRGCLHLLDQRWEPIKTHPVPARLQSQMMIVVAPEARDQRRAFGFAASNVTERVELLLAVFGQTIPPLQAWSEQGGEGTTEQRESFRQHLAEPITRERPRIAGRMLIDVVPPPPVLRK